MHTYMHTYMLFTHSSSKRVHVDTPTNVTELFWNQVPQPTYICGLDFIQIRSLQIYFFKGCPGQVVF